ncbi:MAG: hypothetical protein ACYTFI_01495 [Planctomycetota bacterium]|jgi:hypothetical protein
MRQSGRAARHLVICSVAVISPVLVSQAAVPPPSATPAKIIVNGRTSTAVDIKIMNVGQQLPKTFSAPKVKSIRGYDWYVSQHFALRSEVSDKESRDYLTISELAYPHCVWMFGGAPAGSDSTRIALSFSKSLDRLKKASDIDVGGVGWRGGGGGVTLHGNWVSYNYPGGGLRAHKRGLVMHENLHAFQMALMRRALGRTPVWFFEGITHAIEQHVYDPVKKQLTVMVLDRVAGNNYTDSGLADLRKDFVEAEQFWLGKEGMGYQPDIYQLWMQFLWSDIDRQMRHRVWLKECIARDPGVSREAFSSKIMPELFNVDRLNNDWRAWIAERQNSFHWVDWGFEQEADKLVSYGWPNWGRYAQKNVNLLLKDRPETDDPFVMDWPVYAERPATIGEVKRGVAEPAVGCEIDFSRTFKRHGGRGLAGLGFGVGGTGKRKNGKSNVDQEHFDIVLAHVGRKDKAHLLLDGSTLGLPSKTEKFEPAFLDAVAKARKCVGVTVKVAPQALEIALRSGEGDAMRTHRTRVPIAPKVRTRILSRPWCVLSKGSYHGFTIFPDVNRDQRDDYATPAPAGRTRFLPTAETCRLYHAAWRLGNQAPASLIALRDNLASSAARSQAVQREAQARFWKVLPEVAADIGRCRDKQRAGEALAHLLGLDLQFRAEPGRASGEAVLTASLTSRHHDLLKGHLHLSVAPEKPLDLGEATALTVTSEQGFTKTWRVRVPAQHQSSMAATVVATITWQGMTARLERQQSLYPSVPRWYTLSPLDNKGDGRKDTVLPPEEEPIDLTKSYIGKGGKRVSWRKRERPAGLSPARPFVVSFGGARNAAAYAVTWFDSPVARDAVLGIGSDDGVVAWLNDKRVHRNLVHRGHVAKGDKVPVKLKAGRNKLLLKVTQAWGGWCTSVHVLDTEGNEFTDLTYSLGPENTE